jgi:Protein of unknown function (DUF4199)
MQNHPVRFGFYAGGMVVVLELVLYFIDKTVFASVGSLVEFIFIISFMTKAVSATKADMLGFISFREAFKQAWLTFILATTIVVIFSFVFINYIDPSLKEIIKTIQLDAYTYASEWLKVPEGDKEAMLASIENADAFDIKSIAFGLPFSFIFPGVFYSMIMALIMKKEQRISQP